MPSYSTRRKGHLPRSKVASEPVGVAGFDRRPLRPDLAAVLGRGLATVLATVVRELNSA
jgi:hypothetical protein